MNIQPRISKGTIATAAENQKDLHEKNKLVRRDWVVGVIFLVQINILMIFRGRCDRYFWDIRLKIYRLPNFNMLFQF